MLFNDGFPAIRAARIAGCRAENADRCSGAVRQRGDLRGGSPRLPGVGARSRPTVFYRRGSRWTKVPSSRFASADCIRSIEVEQRVGGALWCDRGIAGACRRLRPPAIPASRRRPLRLRTFSRVADSRIAAHSTPARPRHRRTRRASAEAGRFRIARASPRPKRRAAERFEPHQCDHGGSRPSCVGSASMKRRNSASAGATLPCDGGTRASRKISIAAFVRSASDGSSRPAALCATRIG